MRVSERSMKDLETIAKSNGWNLNPDHKKVEMLLKGMNSIAKNFGEFYCPCKAKRIPENICPCKAAQTEIDAKGKCHCGLFVRSR